MLKEVFSLIRNSHFFIGRRLPEQLHSPPIICEQITAELNALLEFAFGPFDFWRTVVTEETQMRCQRIGRERRAPAVRLDAAKKESVLLTSSTFELGLWKYVSVNHAEHFFSRLRLQVSRRDVAEILFRLKTRAEEQEEEANKPKLEKLN